MMPGFREPIAVERTGEYDGADRALWRLTRPLLFYSAVLGCWLMVPAGFVTNYASVPRLPFVYWYCGDRVYDEPALHDFLYTVHGIYVVELDAEGEVASAELRPIDRERSDGLFLEALLLNPRIPDGMARTMHAGVRVGGGGSWKADTSVRQPALVDALVLPG